jgi:hypothetical protein
LRHRHSKVAHDPVEVLSPDRCHSLELGDLFFIRVPVRPFREVASATVRGPTMSGVVVDMAHQEPLIAESTFPLSTDDATVALRRALGRGE